MAAVRLSPSALSLFSECPRCFWLERNQGIRRPRGIFPSLPGGMDRAIKLYFDRYRRQGKLPPELQGKVDGLLFGDQMRLDRWRDWKLTDLKYEDVQLQVSLTGALDDCVVKNGLHSPLDYKTRGSALKEDSTSYYQDQLNCYCLILESSGFRTNSSAYLVYYFPRGVEEYGKVTFSVEPYRITTSVEAARELVSQGVKCLRGDIPASSPSCEYCNWLAGTQKVFQGI